MRYDIDKLLEEYDIRKENSKPLIDEVKYILYRAINKENIKIHSLIQRIKGFDSFLDKSKRKGFKHPFNAVHDLIGFRIICLFLEDINKIGELLNKEFNIFGTEDKSKEMRYNVFGYMASHYKAKLKDESTLTGLAKDYTFEIQVRTIAQDAWASLSHYLEYKKESVLPINLKRDFYALSGLFYIADTHFSILRQEQTKTLYHVLEKLQKDR